ncbi:MAG: archaeal proteasome endopeptidase complex subunit beta [Candidatus Helarchaeota archaeon]
MTTTIGIVCKDGIVFGTDRRATEGYYVAHKHSKKIYKIVDHIGLTTAGIVADAQTLVDIMQAECNLYQINRMTKISVSAAARLFSNVLFNRRYFPYITQIIIGGMDSSGPKIYTLDPVGSLIEENSFCATGSGTPYAIGVLEDSYDEKKGLEINDAIPIAIHSVRSSIERDIGSGNGIDIVTIDKDGYKEIPDEIINSELKKIGKEI